MKAVVPANLLCSNEPREFCDLQTICFRYDEGRECRSSLTIFMREVIKVGFTSNHRVITMHESIRVTNSGSGCASK
jgi:hypothetical protein